MTALALRMCGQRNGVSKLHGEVSRRMWQSVWPDKPTGEVPISHVTNGIHVPAWIGGAMNRIYRKYLGPDWIEQHDDPALWERILEVPDEELWDAHLHLKRKLMALMRERARRRRIEGLMTPEQVLCAGTFLDPDALIVGFARRFATYKRAALMSHDVERLKRLLHDRYRPVQFIFAGKAHPADEEGKRLLQQVYNMAKDPAMGGRIAFIEDYDLQVARYLVQGVDVWLNTPRRPHEASGTSGQKVAANGIPNLSVLDGWWAEGYNGANGWAIVPEQQHDDAAAQDAADAEALYQLLENEVVPLFYKRDADNVPRGWVQVMKEAIRTAVPAFCTRRMVKEYTERFYVPAARRAAGMS
jgi:starch phosphorylase